LAFLKVVRAARIELARPRTTDFLTTSIFIAISVRGLEYTFTIAIALGVARLLSTPSLSSLARDWHFKAFPDFGQFYFQSFL
jgi:hypothetical protein